MLRPGKRGLGFGVGRDPLAALFASFGCEITATDLDVASAAQRGWVETGQFGGSLDTLDQYQLCDPALFAQRVTFQTADMNAIPAELKDYDFTWSACAFEHLGSIVKGQDFILHQMSSLNPGGVAVHSTEFNVFSNHATVTEGETVLFRRRDIEWLVDELRRDGHSIEVDFNAGADQSDRYVDIPPWSGPHLKLQIGDYVSTSLVLVVEKSLQPLPIRPAREANRRLRRSLASGNWRTLDAYDAVERRLRTAITGLISRLRR